MSRSQINKGYLYQKRKWILLLWIIDGILALFSFSKKPINLEKNETNSIVIIKPDHLGDMLMTTSILPVLKEEFTKAKIDIVAGEWNKDILEGNPYINKVIVYNNFKLNRKGSKTSRLLQDFRTFIAAAKEIKNKNYDVCFILRSYGQNGIVLAKAGKCKNIVGHTTGGFGSFLDKSVRWNEGAHETEHYLEVFEGFTGKKYKSDNLKYEIYYSEEDRKYVTNIISKYELSNKRIVVIHPGTANVAKMWDIDKWREVSLYLKSQNYKVVITGISSEKYLSEKIAGTDNLILDLTGKFTVKQLAYFFSFAQCVLTVDTLAAHLGAAMCKKVVAIYTGINDVRQWKPLGNNVIILKKDVPCMPCYKGDGCKDMKCMNISVMDVIREI